MRQTPRAEALVKAKAIESGANEKHSFSSHPTLWKWLVERANLDYGGNVSAAIAGLILYDRGVTNAKKMKGQPHRHYRTPGIVSRRDMLDAAIREIESSDSGFNAATWLELQFREQRREESAE